MAQRSTNIDPAKLTRFRRDNGLTQERLATLAQCDPRTVKKAESGEAIDLDVLRRIAEALKIEPARLLAAPGTSADPIVPSDDGALFAMRRLQIGTHGGEGHFANRFLARFGDQAASWGVLNRRCEVNADLKRAIGEFFWERYLPLLVNAKIERLYFESGSSIAFAAEALMNHLNADWAVFPSTTVVETNNMLVLTQLLCSRKQLSWTLFPDGPPEHKYGATFGPIRSISPALSNGHVSKEAEAAMEAITNHFVDTYEDGMILGAASGIVLSGPPAGPHVGSHQNMLFKRALATSHVPTVLFLDETKLHLPFIEGRCFAVFETEDGWNQHCATTPLAVACAFKCEETARGLLDKLKGLGLVHIEGERPGMSPWSAIVSNARFWAIRAEWLKRANATVGLGGP